MSEHAARGAGLPEAVAGATAHGSPAAVAERESAGPVLQAARIYKEFPSGEGRLEVLKGVDFALTSGETVSIVGESGAGKSTLLQILGGLDRPTRGQVILAGAHLGRLDDRSLSRVRNRELGFVFQFHHLLMEFSALENVMMPLLIRGMPRAEAQPLAQAVLERVGLGERLSHQPRALSGGEQQRVAVARAIVHRPSVILADEPSGNLDHRNSSRLHELLFELTRERRAAFVVVTHNRELAGETDRCLALEDGLLHAT
ncbi:MAG TPA: ABC transporter ATP-binding protein [Gemmatimonadota bacterium]|jgi:lipoprotein-releasing system ATP-binding protein